MDVLIKKVVAAAIMPLPAISLFLLLGVALLWSNRTRSFGRWLVTIALAALVLIGYGVPFRGIAADLERRYPALVEIDTKTAPRWIVVLGAGAQPDREFPLSSYLMDDALYRMVEAMRLHRLIGGSRILFSGGPVLNSASSGETSAQLARALGVTDPAIAIEARARDTIEEAFYIRQTIGDAPFILVTSALHMPRAMFLFESEGLKPVPAPTQHRIRTAAAASQPANFLPSIVNFAIAHATVHEVVGMWWAKLRKPRAAGTV